MGPRCYKREGEERKRNKKRDKSGKKEKLFFKEQRGVKRREKEGNERAEKMYTFVQ